MPIHWKLGAKNEGSAARIAKSMLTLSAHISLNFKTEIERISDVDARTDSPRRAVNDSLYYSDFFVDTPESRSVEVVPQVLYCTILHSTAQRYTAQHRTGQHCTAIAQKSGNRWRLVLRCIGLERAMKWRLEVLVVV